MQINITEGKEKEETTVRLAVPRSKLDRNFNVMDFIRKKERGSETPIPFVIREGSLDDLISDEMSQLSVDMCDRAEV